MKVIKVNDITHIIIDPRDAQMLASGAVSLVDCGNNVAVRLGDSAEEQRAIESVCLQQLIPMEEDSIYGEHAEVRAAIESQIFGEDLED